MLIQPTDKHCAHCFDTLIGSFKGNPQPSTTPTSNIPSDPSYPMFVSWTKSETRQLRGCIGTFSPVELWAGLAKYSLESARKDSRFSPIAHTEIPSLSVHVSLLGNFEECSDWDDWEVGMHGVQIFYNSKFSATFLPEVAMEQQWTKKQTIRALLNKAGYTKNDYDKEFLEVVRYESKKHSLSYKAYQDYDSSK